MVEKTEQNWMSHEDYRAIQINATSLQEKLIIRLLGPGLIMPPELLRIKQKDFDLMTGELLLRNGEGNARKVQLSAGTKDMFLVYIITERSLLTDEAEAAGAQPPEQMFLYRSAEGNIRPMDIMHLVSMFSKAADRAGIGHRGLTLFSLWDYGIWLHVRNAYYALQRRDRDLETVE